MTIPAKTTGKRKVKKGKQPVKQMLAKILRLLAYPIAVGFLIAGFVLMYYFPPAKPLGLDKDYRNWLEATPSATLLASWLLFVFLRGYRHLLSKKELAAVGLMTVALPFLLPFLLH